MKPWDQKEGESNDAYKAFRLWIDHQDSVKNTSEFRLVLRDNGIGFTESTIETYRLRFEWKRRARSYANWLRRKTELRIAEAMAATKLVVMEIRSETTIKVARKAAGYIDMIPLDFDADTSSRTIANICNATDALRKIIDVIGMGSLDVDDLSRELAKRDAGKAAGRRKTGPAEPDPEELCQLPGESDEVQSGDPEAS